MFTRLSYFAVLLFVAAAGAGPVLNAWSQTGGGGRPERLIYREDFEGRQPDLMLGGQIGFDTDTSWLVSVENGRLVFFNDSNPKQAHYDYIKWVRFEGTDELSLTKDGSMAVTVTPENTGPGGAGILIATGQRGDYWMFTVSREGQYHLLRKQNRKLELAYSGNHEALAEEASNRLAYAFEGNRIVFYANDAEITRVPFDRKREGHSGLALAAYGLGRFLFDDVEISGKRSNSTAQPGIRRMKATGAGNPAAGQNCKEAQDCTRWVPHNRTF